MMAFKGSLGVGESDIHAKWRRGALDLDLKGKMLGKEESQAKK